MANWFAVYRISDGAFISSYSDDATAPTAAQLIAKGYAQKAVAGPIDQTEWDPIALAVKVPTVVVSANETLRQTLLAVNPATGLTAAQQTQALQLLLSKLGPL